MRGKCFGSDAEKWKKALEERKEGRQGKKSVDLIVGVERMMPIK